MRPGEVGVGTVGNVAVAPTQPSQATFTAPANPGQVATVSTQPVSITTAGGTSNPLPYFYVAAPTVNDLSAHLGPATGGNTVAVFGSNLTLTSAVTFGGVPASFSAISDTQVVANSPGGAAGTVNVVAHTPAGSSNALPYVYDPS